MHLCRNINEVSEALEARNQMYQLHLAGEKFLKITQYKGKWAVDIREYHALNSIPSKRGIRLTPEDWSRFVQATNNGDIERVMNAADRHHTFTLKEDSVQNKANGKMQPEAYLHAVVSTAKKEAKKEELRRKLADIKKKTLILKERLSKKLKSR
uniref:Transcriptional coactivator p15 (PC4) C-terminal domain-containing protein n=2 Tax=Bigelowiella natans TaxID=227086 RepID=A0A6U3E0J9_BIGNA|mmetsp:Transcript_1417/g.2115  ORF Transcript_1417/g.2115 Transcript_1417/m.2115 type:complete len:154 (+) Transcript_1417:677-1138(+)